MRGVDRGPQASSFQTFCLCQSTVWTSSYCRLAVQARPPASPPVVQAVAFGCYLVRETTSPYSVSQMLKKMAKKLAGGRLGKDNKPEKQRDGATSKVEENKASRFLFGAVSSCLGFKRSGERRFVAPQEAPVPPPPISQPPSFTPASFLYSEVPPTPGTSTAQAAAEAARAQLASTAGFSFGPEAAPQGGITAIPRSSSSSSSWSPDLIINLGGSGGGAARPVKPRPAGMPSLLERALAQLAERDHHITLLEACLDGLEDQKVQELHRHRQAVEAQATAQIVLLKGQYSQIAEALAQQVRDARRELEAVRGQQQQLAHGKGKPLVQRG